MFQLKYLKDKDLHYTIQKMYVGGKFFKSIILLLLILTLSIFLPLLILSLLLGASHESQMTNM